MDVCSLFNDAFQNSDYIASNGETSEAMNLKGCKGKWLWPNLRRPTIPVFDWVKPWKPVTTECSWAPGPDEVAGLTTEP
jgi:hypothetical protein